MKRKKFDLGTFVHWLDKCGAEVLPTTNEWELLRVKTCDGLFVAYRNKRGKETWANELLELRAAFMAGHQRSLSPSRRERVRLRPRIEKLAKRDGLECWFCAGGFENEDSDAITIEHLCSRVHGGPNHISNLVLACEPCNQEADNLSVAEKVRLRDQKRMGS